MPKKNKKQQKKVFVDNNFKMMIDNGFMLRFFSFKNLRYRTPGYFVHPLTFDDVPIMFAICSYGVVYSAMMIDQQDNEKVANLYK